MRIMSGLVPTVKTFAIITWENPRNGMFDNKQNRDASNELKKKLKDENHSFIQIKGKYNDLENPFVILNISEKEAEEIGFNKKYEQDSIIFGKVLDKYVEFSMVYHNKTSLIRKIWLSNDRSKDNLYSEYKGRKFSIPFFDDEYANSILKNGKVTTSESTNNLFYGLNENVKVDEYEEESKRWVRDDVSGKSKYLNRGRVYSDLRRIYKERL